MIRQMNLLNVLRLFESNTCEFVCIRSAHITGLPVGNPILGHDILGNFCPILGHFLYFLGHFGGNM